MASEQNQADTYLTTRVLTASPEELRLMLLDGAIKFCRQGREGLANKNYETCYNGYSRCRAILVELTTSIKPQPDLKLYERLTSLYTYMITRLMQSSHEKDVAKADEVIKLLEYERETWTLAMEQLATTKRGQAAPSHPANANQPHAPSANRALVGARVGAPISFKG